MLEQDGLGASGFGYTSEQVDATGLVYLRARYYQPEVGRFLTADTIVPDPLRSMGWNRYVYVENNPIRYTDPSGHCGGIRGGNLAVMEMTPCIGGGINVESGSGGGGGVFIAIGLGVVVGYTAAVLDDFLETFPLDTPIFEPLPGLIPPEIEQEIIPCGDSPTAPPFELPPFDVHFPSIDDIFSADPIEPGIELPNHSTIERTPHGEERHGEPDRPTSQAYQDSQNAREVYYDNYTGNTIYVGPKGRTHIFTPDGYHHTSFRSDKSYRQRKVKGGQWTRQ